MIDPQLIFLAQQSTLFAELCQHHDWQQKYRLLMQTGKALPPLPEQYKRDELRVNGCESAAWLVHQLKDGRHFWAFDSDARIIKGIVSALLTQCNGLDANRLAALDFDVLYHQLGLSQGLSASRNNGVSAVLKTLRQQIS